MDADEAKDSILASETYKKMEWFEFYSECIDVCFVLIVFVKVLH